MEQVQKSFPSSPDNKVTMSPTEMFDSQTATTDYAINALSHPSDDTYRKNLSRYLDSKGFDLVSEGRQLYIGDRNSHNRKPITKNFLGDMIGSSPEIGGSILGGAVGFSAAGPVGAMAGAVAGGVGGDAVQQMINSYFMGEELTTGERTKELGKSAALSAAGEVGGNLLGRAITPLRGINKAEQAANTALAGKYEVPLTPATATGHEGLAQFEETMAKGTLGGKQIAKMKEDEILGIENTARDLLENKMGGTGNQFDSGSALAYDVGKQQKEAAGYFNEKYADLVERAGVNEIPLSNLRATAQTVIDRAEDIPAFKNGIDKFVQNVMDSPNKLTYPEYQELRTLIGSKIKDASVTGQSGSKEAYKKLYKSINDDFDKSFPQAFVGEKKVLDQQYITDYKQPFEDSFTRGVTGSGRNTIDPERIGGLIANSSGKANVAANTADAGFKLQPKEKATQSLFESQHEYVKNNVRPNNAMSSAADYILGKSVAADGGMSIAKVRTNLGGGGSQKGSGVDTLLGLNRDRLGSSARERLFAGGRDVEGGLLQMKDDIVSLIEMSGKNKKIANTSGTAYMNELIRMKNDPMSALVGFFSDQSISRAYRNKTVQKWLTNDIISSEQSQKLIRAIGQTTARGSNE